MGNYGYFSSYGKNSNTVITETNEHRQLSDMLSRLWADTASLVEEYALKQSLCDSYSAAVISTSRLWFIMRDIDNILQIATAAFSQTVFLRYALAILFSHPSLGKYKIIYSRT